MCSREKNTKENECVFARKQKGAGTRRRAHEAGAGKGGLSVDRSLLFQRLGGERPHQRDSTDNCLGAPTEHQDSRKPQQNAPSGRMPGSEHCSRNTSLSLIQNKAQTTLQFSSSIRGRASRAITPQPTFISRLSPAHRPLIRSSLRPLAPPFKHASCQPFLRLPDWPSEIFSAPDRQSTILAGEPWSLPSHRLEH